MKKLTLEKNIIKNSLKRYNENLAAILIFGSYNTGRFVFGISDIDSIILLKREDNIDFENGKHELGNELADIKLKILHFKTLKDYKEHIYQEGSWSSWITVIKGSKVVYSTPEFEDFRRELHSNPINKIKLLDYVIKKDKFELEGYLKDLSGWDLTKGLFSHIRRKLQILNYYLGNELNFDYNICLRNLKEIDNKESLEELGDLYNKREILHKKEADNYFSISKLLTRKISGLL